MSNQMNHNQQGHHEGISPHEQPPPLNHSAVADGVSPQVSGTVSNNGTHISDIGTPTEAQDPPPPFEPQAKYTNSPPQHNVNASNAYQGIEVKPSPTVNPEQYRNPDPGLVPAATEHQYNGAKHEPNKKQNGQVQATPAASGHQYNVAMPLHALQQGTTPVDCPVCGVGEVTQVGYETGSYTHMAALVACCFCLGCIPYMVSSFKDVEHKCANCGTLLAVWHRSGGTEIKAHPSMAVAKPN